MRHGGRAQTRLIGAPLHLRVKPLDLRLQRGDLGIQRTRAFGDRVGFFLQPGHVFRGLPPTLLINSFGLSLVLLWAVVGSGSKTGKRSSLRPSRRRAGICQRVSNTAANTPSASSATSASGHVNARPSLHNAPKLFSANG